MPPALSRLRYRLRNDFRLSIITVFGACAVLAIAPFGVMRMLQEQWLIALIDFGIVFGLVGATVYAWRGGNLDRAGLCITVISTAGSVVIFTLLGWTGLLWMYPALLANFFLVSPRIAFAAALVATSLALWLQPEIFESSVQYLAVAATLALVSVFACIFALRTSMQRDALEELASRDPLTGARNRRAMEEEIAIALNAHQRSSRPIALAVLDLDHFKRVNDRHGHEVGDHVLQQFVSLVQQSTRATDRLFRYGGEEFVLLMEHTDEIALERTFAHLQRRVHQSLRAAGQPVTFSMGAAVLRHGEDRDAWFVRADVALYRAKQGGRDRLVVDTGAD